MGHRSPSLSPTRVATAGSLSGGGWTKSRSGRSVSDEVQARPRLSGPRRKQKQQRQAVEARSEEERNRARPGWPSGHRRSPGPRGPPRRGSRRASRARAGVRTPDPVARRREACREARDGNGRGRCGPEEHLGSLRAGPVQHRLEQLPYEPERKPALKLGPARRADPEAGQHLVRPTAAWASLVLPIPGGPRSEPGGQRLERRAPAPRRSRRARPRVRAGSSDANAPVRVLGQHLHLPEDNWVFLASAPRWSASPVRTDLVLPGCYFDGRRFPGLRHSENLAESARDRSHAVRAAAPFAQSDSGARKAEPLEAIRGGRVPGEAARLASWADTRGEPTVLIEGSDVEVGDS